MHRVIVLGILVVGLARMSHPATAEGQAHREPLKVDTTGVTATIKYEAVLEDYHCAWRTCRRSSPSRPWHPADDRRHHAVHPARPDSDLWPGRLLL
jgi:hypothetical protein